MTSMLERCARALLLSESGVQLEWDKLDVITRGAFKKNFRAVLTTLRDEPSEGMLEAGREHGWGIPADCYMADVPAIFAAMLTAALEE